MYTWKLSIYLYLNYLSRSRSLTLDWQHKLHHSYKLVDVDLPSGMSELYLIFMK